MAKPKSPQTFSSGSSGSSGTSASETILLDHGSGGKLSHQLVKEMLIPAFDNPTLSALDDGAMLAVEKGRIAFSTDTFVVDPIFFPGGDIGELAVNGTVNDLAMCGAIPLALSAGLILEEGFPMDHLRRIIKSMAAAAEKAGVKIVTGDTKVVPRGAADKIFINTSGIGRIPDGVDVSSTRAQIGDKIILSGTMADHGVTILTQREGMAFDAPLQSDTAALNGLVLKMLSVCPDLHVLRDPTRGGVGTTLNEIAAASGKGIRIYEAHLPVKPAVAGLCDLLGFDPLYVANEGKLLAFVPPEYAEPVLSAMRADPFGKDGAIIGEVVDDHPGRVFMETPIGGARIVDMLAGEQLPRIC